MVKIYTWFIEDCKTGRTKSARASSIKALKVRYYGDHRMSIDPLDTDDVGAPISAYICKGSTPTKEGRVLYVERTGDSEVIKNTKAKISSAKAKVGKATTWTKGKIANAKASAKASAKARKTSKGTAPSKSAPPEKKRSEPEDDDWDEDEYDVY